jgi:hypothetical protein
MGEKLTTKVMRFKMTTIKEDIKHGIKKVMVAAGAGSTHDKKSVAGHKGGKASGESRRSTSSSTKGSRSTGTASKGTHTRHKSS